jgi:hypothetical protein
MFSAGLEVVEVHGAIECDVVVLWSGEHRGLFVLDCSWVVRSVME